MGALIDFTAILRRCEVHHAVRQPRQFREAFRLVEIADNGRDAKAAQILGAGRATRQRINVEGGQQPRHRTQGHVATTDDQ